MNVVIVGLGLIGGSVALALREARPGAEIAGVDRAAVLATEAVKRLTEQRIDADDGDAVDAAFAASSLIVLAAPVRAIELFVPRALAAAPLVTDCGSTKRSIALAADASPRRGRFVPGHPMAGARVGGAELARADLFRARRWLLCPENSDADAADEVEALVKSFGAVPVRFGIAEHDRAVARTSHATQLVTSALAVAASGASAEQAAGPAYEGATRAAGGAEGIWNDIFATNSDEVASALGDIISELERVRSGLASHPPNIDAARALLQRAKQATRNH
ncbi:MAG TPA: prephenate dehydrogenase/arogenate dehydrogenase family protein [Polyangiaceae bacterium]